MSQIKPIVSTGAKLTIDGKDFAIQSWAVVDAMTECFRDMGEACALFVEACARLAPALVEAHEAGKIDQAAARRLALQWEAEMRGLRRPRLPEFINNSK
jgi:hypothetical protein